MNNKRNYTGTVCLFEFGNYLRSKSFIISTIFTVLILAVTMNIPGLGELLDKISSPSTAKQIIITNESKVPLDLNELAAALPTYEISVKQTLERSELLAACQDKETAGVFIINSANDFEWITTRQHFAQKPEITLAKLCQKQARRQLLAKQGFSPDAIALFLADSKIVITEEAAASGKSYIQTQVYTYVLVFLLYMAILNYGQLTAVSVAAEKSTRAMELLITSTKPRYLINGKVFGTGLAGLTQMLVIGSFYYLFFLFNKTALLESNFFTNSLRMPLSTFLMALMIFILSYLTFAFLFGALGSLVNRSEEVGQVIAPISLVYMAVIFLGIFATFQPDAFWVNLCSYIPLIGPLLFFVRFSMLNVQFWEMALALSIHTAAVIAASLLAEKIYRSGVLRYGKPPRFKDALQLIFARSQTK